MKKLETNVFFGKKFNNSRRSALPAEKSSPIQKILSEIQFSFFFVTVLFIVLFGVESIRAGATLEVNSIADNIIFTNAVSTISVAPQNGFPKSLGLGWDDHINGLKPNQTKVVPDGGNRAFQFGASSDRLTLADYTSDSKTDIAFRRPSNGNSFILRSEDFSFYAFSFGAAGDVSIAGDYDSDGRFDAGVFRPSISTWYVQRTTAGMLIKVFGQTGDQPVPNVFVP